MKPAVEGKRKGGKERGGWTGRERGGRKEGGTPEGILGMEESVFGAQPSDLVVKFQAVGHDENSTEKAAVPLKEAGV